MIKSNYINHNHLIQFWNKRNKAPAIALSRKLYKDRRYKKNLLFYLENGNNLKDAGLISEAYKFFKKGAELSPDNELASMLKYIVLVKLHKYSLAIKELDRFLSKHQAKAYKVTLIELLEEMNIGNALLYKRIILKHCKKNRINISKYIRQNNNKKFNH